MSNTFTMAVGNNSPDTLGNVLVTHCCNSTPTSIYLASLGPYTTCSAVTCTTFSGHNDYYLFQFTRNGKVYQANSYCNWSSPATGMQVQLQSSNYNINYNGNVSGCTGKTYNYST